MTITSNVSGAVLERTRHIAGPSPEGSKLTDAERLHLILMIGRWHAASSAMQIMEATVIQMGIKDALIARGMTADQIAEVFRKNSSRGPVAVADAIAVHPSLKDAYLD